MTAPDSQPSARTGWRERDHTRGRLIVSLFVLTLPLLATSGAGVAFQLSDLIFLSRIGEQAMAAVTIVNQTIRQMVMMLVMGLCFGTQALIARAIGAGHEDEAEHLAGQSILIGFGFALLVAVFGTLFAEPLFGISNPDPNFVPYGLPYLRWVSLLGFGMVFMQLFGAILGGAGDTTTPFLVMFLQTALSIAGEWIFVFGRFGSPQLGVTGVALGVALGQFAGVALGSVVLLRGASRIHLRWRHLRPDAAVMLRIAKLSWPPALQMGITVLMTLVYLRLAGGFGEKTQAAYAVGLRLGMVVPMVCFPLASASATLVGQAIGAGKVRRAWQAIGLGTALHCTVMWSFALTTFLLRTEILRAFSDDPEVVAIGAEYLLYSAGAFFVWGFYFVSMRALQGAGDMLAPMAISIGTTLCVAIPLAHWLSRESMLGRRGLWTAFLLTSIVTTLATVLRLLQGKWAQRARAAAPAAGAGAEAGA